jgi:hypothetical protein
VPFQVHRSLKNIKETLRRRHETWQAAQILLNQKAVVDVMNELAEAEAEPGEQVEVEQPKEEPQVSPPKPWWKRLQRKS